MTVLSFDSHSLCYNHHVCMPMILQGATYGCHRPSWPAGWEGQRRFLSKYHWYWMWISCSYLSWALEMSRMIWTREDWWALANSSLPWPSWVGWLLASAPIALCFGRGKACFAREKDSTNKRGWEMGDNKSQHTIELEMVCISVYRFENWNDHHFKPIPLPKVLGDKFLHFESS